MSDEQRRGIRRIVIFVMGDPTLLARTGGVMPQREDNHPSGQCDDKHPSRTLDDIATDLALAARIVAHERARWARAWPSRIVDNLVDDTLDYVAELNHYLDEWARANVMPPITYV